MVSCFQFVRIYSGDKVRFSLVGELIQNGGHDKDKVFFIEEYFDAKDSEVAIVVAKAMIQSQKLKQEKHRNKVSVLSAALKDDNEREFWRTSLVLERTRIEVVIPEHFDEEVTPNQ